MKFLAILLLCSSCSYASGSSPICGSNKLAQLTVYSVLRQQGLTLTCGNGESLTVGASSELNQLAALIGASIALAAKSQGIPLPLAAPQIRPAPTLEETLTRLEQRLELLENKP